MSRLNFNLHEWEKEKIAALDRMEAKRVDMEAGIVQGLEQKAVETIILMNKNNITLDVISKVTGKSTKEIEEILEENK